MKYLEMTFDQWIEKYNPVLDEFGEPRLFETNGTDYDFVSKQDASKVWTLCNAGDNDFIENGWHFVNRLNYYVTEIPFSQDEDIFIELPEEWDEDESRYD